MSQEQHSPADWMLSNIKDLVGAQTGQVKEASRASLDASRAIMNICKESAAIFRDRGDEAFRTGIAVMEAAFKANSEELDQLAEARNLQDVVRLQMLWGANLALAICHAIKANTARTGSGAAPNQAATA